MLLTKLHIPSAGNNPVHRSKLFEKLKAGLGRKLILISAPAGFGKTTLLSDWISKHKIPAAWYSLDNSDNDPVKFLGYIISGIQSIRQESGQNVLKLLKSPNRPGNESIVDLLINDITNIDQNFLLVLDDFHLIENKDIIKLVTYFLEHIPSNIHIVISTRSDPALPVARLRSQHQLVELRLKELGFSANDISVLFNKKLKIALSVDDVLSLETKTEGWIAGLQLVALSLHGREDISGFINDLKGDNRYIMDYLVEEVLKVQTDNTREFLLQTSILEQMSAPLCNTLLNRTDSQLMLEKLEKNNMFVIPLDAERNWYRYHHLFAQLLKQRLQLKDKTTVNELHNKATTWFKDNSMPLLAIEHAIETKDFEKSLQFLGEIAETMWENGQHAAIMKYGDLLPNELIKKNADFCLYYSWILIIAGQIQKAGPFLASAEIITKKKINDKNLTEEELRHSKKMLGKISVAFAYMNSIAAHPEKTFDYSKTAMENLSEDDPLWFSWGWYTIGIREMVIENFSESISAYEKALEYGKKTGNIYLISTIAINLAYIESRMGLYTSSFKKCSDLLAFMKEKGYAQITKTEWHFAGLYSCMAGIQCMRADLDDALENIKTAYQLCKNESNNSFKVIVLLVYSLILYGVGDTAGAIKMLNESDDIIKLNKIAPGAMAIYIAMKGLMLIKQNEPEKANDFFKENGLVPDKKISYSDEHGYVAYAFLLIEELKFKKAEALLSKLYAIAQAGNRVERMIELKILYAILYKMTGNKEQSLGALIESLEYAADENIIMSFLLYHDKIGDLLAEIYKIQATSKTGIPRKLLDKLKLALGKKEKLNKNYVPAGLSVREQDILYLIAEDLTNHEIADKLFISLNTVKTHLKNLYIKLEANNRKTAVDKAKELGLI